ncbi:MAG: hypothetical protein Q9199_006263 [Rusavskia elegans]
MPRVFAFFGIIDAFHEMIFLGDYTVSSFDFLYNRRPVGGVTFGTPRALLNAHHTSGTAQFKEVGDKPNSSTQPIKDIKSMSSTALRVITTRAASLTVNSRLSADFNYRDGTINKYDMFLAILSILEHAAQWPGDAESSDEAWHFIRCRFDVYPANGTGPPYLIFYWLIDAIAAAATYTIEHHEYRSLDMRIKVDRVNVARGEFRPGV